MFQNCWNIQTNTSLAALGSLAYRLQRHTAYIMKWFWSNFTFHQRLLSKVVFHQKSPSIKGHLPSKVVFYRRLSSKKGCLPSEVFFHQRLSSIKGLLPLDVIFHLPWPCIDLVLAQIGSQSDIEFQWLMLGRWWWLYSHLGVSPNDRIDCFFWGEVYVFTNHLVATSQL